jgi:hypothetical protein
METADRRRILIVAHRSVATPTLAEEVRRHTEQRPCELTLLIPDADDPEVAAWTLRHARKLLSNAVGTTVDGMVTEGDDPYGGIATELSEHEYDEVLISTLPTPGSQWLREKLPERVEALGVQVTVVTAATPLTSREQRGTSE